MLKNTTDLTKKNGYYFTYKAIANKTGPLKKQYIKTK